MLLIWPILWILFMLGLILAVIVTAVRESSAKAQAAKSMMATQPPMPMGALPGAESGGGQDLFAQSGFEDPNAGSVEFAAFDENAFK